MSDSLNAEESANARSRASKGGNFLFGLGRKEKIKRPGREPIIRVRFYWRRVFLCLLLIGFVGWLSAGAALYFYFKERRDFEKASYFKMLVLPFRLDQHRKEMGDFYVEKGMNRIAAGEFGSGFHLLRAGLARSPANPEARLMLARIFSSPGFGEQRLAIQALVEGLKFSDRDEGFLSLDYLQTLFYLLAMAERDEERIEISEELITTVSDPQLADFLALQAIHGEIELGRYISAMRRLEVHGLSRTPAGILLLSSLLDRAGYLRTALSTLEMGVEAYPSNRELSDALLGLLFEEKMWEELLSQANFRRLLQPNDLMAWVAQLDALAGLEREEAILPLCQEILDRFPTPETGFRLLRFAVDDRNLEVANLVLEQLRQLDQIDGAHFALVSLVYLRADRTQEALDLLEQSAEEGKPVDLSRALGIRIIASSMEGKEEAALTQLQQFFEIANVQANVYVTLAEFLSDEGYEESAYRILQEGLARHPTNRLILRQILLEHEKDQGFGGSFVDHAEMLVSNRIPEMETLDAVRKELVSDRYLFAPEQEKLVNQIDELKRQAEWISSSRAIATSPEKSLDMHRPLSEQETFRLR